jgi:hypothetical protein
MAESPIASVFVAILPETSKVAEGIRRALRDVDKDMVEAGRRWGREIKDGIGEVKVPVEAQTVDAKTELEKFRREEQRKKIRQQIEFDEADAKGKLAILRKEFDGVGGKFAGAVTPNVALTGIGLIPAAATAATELAGAMQQLAGAGAVMPGVFAGLASSIGVAKLSTEGMSDAFKALDKSADGTKASVDAANKALADLSPNAADAVKTTYGLKGSFDAVRNVGSQNLFAGFSGGLKDLAEHLLPTATKGVDGISRSLNQNLLQAMTSLGSGSSQGLLGRIFGNTADAQGRLTGAIEPVVHAVETLAAAGSDSLPRLADAIGSVANRFNTFITSAEGDGSLHKWISDGLDGFTHLGNIALDLGKSFTAITQAAGGGTGLLGTMDSLTGRMSEFLNSAAGQQELRDFFAKGAEQLGRLRDIAVQLGPVLSGVFQSGLTTANLWLPVIRQSLEVLNRIPGGAQAVVTAFVAWKTIQGPVQLLSSLNNVMNLMKVALPEAAVAGAGGISAAFSALGTITIPIALVAAGGLGADWLSNYLFDKDPLGTSGFKAPPFLPNTPTALNGQPVPGSSPASRIPLPQLTDAQKQALQYQGVDPSTARPEDVYKALGLPVPAPLPPARPPESPFSTRTSASGWFAPPVKAPPLSTYVPPAITSGSGATTPAAATMYPGGYMGDEALLANVPAGTYGRGSGDLTKGLGDCSSAVEDLVNILQGNSTAGASMNTGNEAQWLTAHGFLPGMGGPGDFRVGFNAEHTQATLPGGTNFNWGSAAAAAAGGLAPNSGAFDPAFTAHFYLPVGGDPMSTMYGGTPGSGGLTSSDLSLRNAQQRVDDTQHSQEQAEARLNELRAKGTATDRQLEAAEYAVAKAKREHTDAMDALTVAQDKYNKSMTAGKGGNSDFQSLGGDFMSGIMQAAGFDGTLFKNPLEGGLWKGLTGIANFAGGMNAAASGDNGSLIPGGGGGSASGGLFGLLGNLLNPGAGGPAMPGSPTGMPDMPVNPNSPNVLQAAQFKPPGAAGPGNVTNVDQSMIFHGAPTPAESSTMYGQWVSQQRYAPLTQNLPQP